jgi:hypothetical protein
MSLMSNDKFAEALRSLGVEPETKTSPATGAQTYAFAKSDPFMIALDEHPDLRVQALAGARRAQVYRADPHSGAVAGWDDRQGGSRSATAARIRTGSG